MELSESSSIESDKPTQERNQTTCEWFMHLKKTYGLSVLAMISFVYFSMGFRVLLGLTIKDLFKTQLKLQPAESQIYTSIIEIPWSMKFLVGIFVDNWKILGKDQRNYLKIWGLMMWFSLKLFRSNWNNRINMIKNGVQPTISLLVHTSKGFLVTALAMARICCQV